MKILSNYPKDKCLHELFEVQVERTPDAIAVALREARLTYRELNQRANQLAHYLRNLGVGPEVLASIWIDRSWEMIVGILGILKAGGAYVPLDIAYPRDRLAFMLDDCQAPILLTQHRLIKDLPASRAHVVFLDTEWEVIAQESGENPVNRATAENLIYVIYTSGSTGKPKGVTMPHRALSNLIAWQLRQTSLPSGSRTLQFSSLSFDASFTDMFMTWCSGGTLVIVPDFIRRDIPKLRQFIIDYNIERLNLPFVVLQHLAEDITAQKQLPLCVKEIISTAEQLQVTPSIRRLFAQLPNCSLHNQYGPSETHVVTAFTLIGPPNDWPSLPPIGSPIANTQIYLLDQHLQPVPIGVSGEVYIGGTCLTRGYLNRPDMTAEKFVPNPFSNELGTRLYKTGDLARCLPDGNIEFLGRIDHQVKIRGFRIELGEIGAVLSEHSAVQETVVVNQEVLPGDKRLVAYFVAGQKPVPPVSELRRFLRKKLPEYMIPSTFIVLDAFPLTPNQKIDRRALPIPDITRSQLSTIYVAPRDELEQLLVRLWQEVLNVDTIGIYDNFFELGGDSIKGAILTNRVQEQLGEIVYVTVLFDASTIAELADYFEMHYPEAVAKMSSRRTSPIPSTSNDRINADKVTLFRRAMPSLALPEQQKISTKKNPQMIFILSPPRSGSTLLRVMLGGHSQLFAPPDLDLLPFNTLTERKSALTGKYHFFLEGTVRAIMQIKDCRVEQAQSIMQKNEERHLSTQQFYHLLQQWLPEKTLVDKSTTYALDPEILKRAEMYFDNPLYIHLLRHPYGMIHSFENVKLDQIFFRYEHPFSRRELAELIWLVSHQNLLEFFRQVSEDRQYRVKFEDLVKHPHNTIEGICEFLHLKFHPEMLQPYKEKKQRMTDGLYQVSRMIGDPMFHKHKEIQAEVADTWKKAYTVDFLGDLTWKVAESLGYKQQTEQRDSRLSPINRVSRDCTEPILTQLSQLSDEEVTSLLNKMLE